MTYLLVGLGGFLGAVCRFAVATWAARLFGGPFPLGTFIVNVSGSFLLGVALAVLEDKALLNAPQRHFLVAGFLGAYTTFSTFSYESLHLFQYGPMLLGVLNVVGSVALGRGLGRIRAGPMGGWIANGGGRPGTLSLALSLVPEPVEGEGEGIFSTFGQ